MRKKGFALIELLVVIAVIALLMAILLPSLQRARRQAKTVVCQSNLRQWGAIFKMYTDGTNGRLPRQDLYSMGMYEPWMYTMRYHCVGSEGIRFCPMATKLADPTGEATDMRHAVGGTLLAWGKLRLRQRPEVASDYYYGSYGANSWVGVPNEGGSFVVGGPSLRVCPDFWKTSDVGGASDIPLYLDSWWWCAWVKHTDSPPEYDGQTTEFPCGCRNSIHRFCINRHDGFVNAAFLDYSVRKVGLKELWTLKWHRGFDTAGPWTGAGGVQPEAWPQWMRRFKDY
jgi:prepilin-type N-terminal cleavage/methylation domain-containing protein